MNILLTGATGYIGRRLKERLLENENVRLRLFVRNSRKVRDKFRDRVELFEGDTLDKDSLRKALQGIDTAYYLIHALGAKQDFQELDRISATNFREACLEASVRRIIYLGGLGSKQTASKHLLSRIETGEILSAKPDLIQTIWFRAGVIIGSGSASFEIIRHLIQNLPIMITPRWVRTKTQPIGIDDVLQYLCQAKDLDFKEGNPVVDIGSEPMSFKEMLLRAAKVMGLKRHLVPFPFLTPNLSSYWLILVTSVPYRIAKALVEGLKSETVIQNENAKKYFPKISPVSYEEALRDALSEIEKNQVISRWCDSSASAACDIKHQDSIAEAVFIEKRTIDLGKISPEKVFLSAQSIGGKTGWHRYGWLWRFVGFCDKLLGGPGLNRGRRDPAALRIGDSLDFWKVADLKKGRRLLLLSQMKVPGKAWLEFSIQGKSFVLTAYFLPKGLWGRIYRLLTKPFHYFIFAGLAKSIVKNAEGMGK